MELMHDYLLIKEVIEESTLEGTDLSIKYDENKRFMVVEIIKASPMLLECYSKEYGEGITSKTLEWLSNIYSVGNKLVINRVAKTPYKDGLYFISYKDVIACVD